MKFINISPKHLFSSKKSRSVSRSDTPSFSSGTSSSSDSSSSNHKDGSGAGPRTPTSVLPSSSKDISAHWPDLSADTHFNLVEAFKLIDKDGDGKIPTCELQTLISRLGVEPPSEEELSLMLEEVDRDGDGCITLEEFSAISTAFGPACGSELRDAFEFFDTDRDGKISAEELLGVFVAIGDERCTLEDCRRMIVGVDTDGDGFVCFEDFSRMMDGRI